MLLRPGSRHVPTRAGVFRPASDPPTLADHCPRVCGIHGAQVCTRPLANTDSRIITMRAKYFGLGAEQQVREGMIYYLHNAIDYLHTEAVRWQDKTGRLIRPGLEGLKKRMRR